MIGVIIAILTSLLFKHLRVLSEFPSSEILITLLMSYSAYLFADLAEMSGVIALLMAGILM